MVLISATFIVCSLLRYHNENDLCIIIAGDYSIAVSFYCGVITYTYYLAKNNTLLYKLSAYIRTECFLIHAVQHK